MPPRSDCIAGDSLLEIGCGPGRLPIGLLRRVGAIKWYQGIDVDRKAIEWCTRFISRYHPTFRFEAIDARHERYNPAGQSMDERFSLAFAAESFDLIYLHSVFASMVENDVRVYAREFRRLLKPDGQVFLTAFVEEDVPPVTLNAEGYIMPCRGPLNVVRYERTFFFSLFTDHGLRVERFQPGVELDRQSALYLRRASEGTTRPSKQVGSAAM